MDLKKLRLGLASHLNEFCEVVAHCRGVSTAEALASEVLPLLDGIQWLEREAARVLAPRRENPRRCPYWLTGLELEIRRVPLGKVLILGPGNYPLFLPGIQAIQALVAGNEVLLKPQAGCLEPLRLLLSLLEGQNITLLAPDVETAQGAIDSGVDLVILTGSVESGKAVLRRCAETLTPVIAELSGEDVVVAGPGADLDLVSRAMNWGGTLNHGNTCMAPRRLICLEEHAARLRELGLQPQVAADLVGAANESAYGLGAALFGDKEWALESSRHLKVGFVTINDLIAPTADPRLPFGGRKQSGFGSTRGAEGLLQLTAPQAVSVRGPGPLYHLDPPSPNDLPILAHYTRFAHGRGLRSFLHLGAMIWTILKERVRRRLARN